MMISQKIFFLLSLALVLLFGASLSCTQKEDSMFPHKGPWLVKIENKTFTEDDFNLMINASLMRLSPKERKEALSEQGTKEKLLESLIQETLLYLAAKEEGIGEEPKVRILTEISRRQLIGQEYLYRRVRKKSDIEVTEKEIDAYYNRYKKELKNYPFKQAQEIARRNLWNEKLQIVMQNEVSQLKEKMKIKRNSDLIDKWKTEKKKVKRKKK